MVRACFALSILGISLVAAVASNSNTSGDDGKQQVMVQLRFCEVDVDQRDDPQAVRVISEPTVLVVEDQSVTVSTGGELHAKDEQGQRYWQGIRATLKPKVADDGSITLDASCERSSPKVAESDAKPIKNGFALHTSLKLKAGEKAILGRSEAGGVASWIEATCAVVTAKAPPKTATLQR